MKKRSPKSSVKRTRSPRKSHPTGVSGAKKSSAADEPVLCDATKTLDECLEQLERLAPGQVLPGVADARRFVKTWDLWENTEGPRRTFFGERFEEQEKYKPDVAVRAANLASAGRKHPERPFWRNYVAAQKYVWNVVARNRAAVLDAMWIDHLESWFNLSSDQLDRVFEQQLELSATVAREGRFSERPGNRVDVRPNEPSGVADLILQTGQFLQSLRNRGCERQVLYLRFYTNKGYLMLHSMMRDPESRKILDSTGLTPCPWTGTRLRSFLSGETPARSLPRPAAHYLLASDFLRNLMATFLDPELPKLFPNAVLFRGLDSKEFCGAARAKNWSALSPGFASTSFSRETASLFVVPPESETEKARAVGEGCVLNLAIAPSVPVLCMVPVSSLWPEMEVLLPPGVRFESMSPNRFHSGDEIPAKVTWTPRGPSRSPRVKNVRSACGK